MPLAMVVTSTAATAPGAIPSPTTAVDRDDDDVAMIEPVTPGAVPVPLAPKHHQTHLQRLVISLRDSVSALGAEATDRRLESWACLIHESMSVYGRYFHSIQHVFDISQGADAVQTISALFHDCIYYNVDGRFLPKQAELLKGVISNESDDGTVIVLTDVLDKVSDPMVAMVFSVFGFEGGQILHPPFCGENEFLSAVLAIRCMEDVLDVRHLFQIAACIEMTIPFRKNDDHGLGPADRLYRRLVKTNDEFGFGLTDVELVRYTQRAVDLGNRDVGNFESPDRAWFLDNTWKLLPESNIPLRAKVTYTVCEYQKAVHGMACFFANLDYRVVFNSFANFPSPEHFHAMRERTCRNIEVARLYTRAKLLSLSVIAALAELTGGDAPIALFVGDLPTAEHQSPRLDDYLDPCACPDPSLLDSSHGIDAEVYDLLVNGRKHDSKFDLRNSPLAAYLYGLMGDEGVERALERMGSHPMTEDKCRALLLSVPKKAVTMIVVNCTKIAITRADRLLEVLNGLKWEDVDMDGYWDGEENGADGDTKDKDDVVAPEVDRHS